MDKKFSMTLVGLIVLIIFIGIIIAFTLIQTERIVEKIDGKEYVIQHTHILVDSKIESTVNSDIEKHLKDGEGEFIYNFYDQITGNRHITYKIIEKCLNLDVPVNLAMALCYQESRFYIYAINGEHNKNGSSDYGLFQLNSYTFSEYDQEYLMDVNNNIHHGIEWLAIHHSTYGDWYKVVIAYNSGDIDDVPQSTIEYMTNIFAKVKEYDQMYWENRLKS